MIRLATRLLLLAMASGFASPGRAVPAEVKAEDVDRAIGLGVKFLQGAQQADGSWKDLDADAATGTTSLAALALLAAGEAPDSPALARALAYLRGFEPERLNSVYAVSLQARVFAEARPEVDRERIAQNVRWLQSALIRPGDRVLWPGSWAYKQPRTRHGDLSNSHYALLGLDAAAEAGVPAAGAAWELAERFLRTSQRRDGGWTYTPDLAGMPTASMTCTGIEGLLVTRARSAAGRESLEAGAVQGCGRAAVDAPLERGYDWLARNFRAGENFGAGQQWKFYYLEGLERVGRLGGRRLLGRHDWFREVAELLVRDQDRTAGFWKGMQYERQQELATCFALMFLGRGRAPVLIQKVRHAPVADALLDPDAVRNLVAAVGRDWRRPLNWEIVDLDAAGPEDPTAPILFFNGHQAPEFAEAGRRALRRHVERGGTLFAEACCGRVEFDRGFRALVQAVFPEPGPGLHLLADDHPIWKARYDLNPGDRPLWGLERDGRTVLIYSPGDLSCGWNLAGRGTGSPVVEAALWVGQNVVDYATGRKPPPDRLGGPGGTAAPPKAQVGSKD